MSGTMNASVETAAESSATRRQAMTWRRLQQIAAVVAVLTFIVPMVAAGSFEVFLAAMAAPFLVGLLLDAFLPRTGAVFLGVVSLFILGSSAVFLAQALVHPESTLDFVPLVLLVLATVIAIAAAVPAYREARGSAKATSLPRTIALVAGLIAVVATAGSLIAAAGTESVAAQPGDLTMTTRDFEFAPASLTADAGTVSVHLTNDDTTRHTFTIDGVADVSVAPGTTQRAMFEVPAGTFRFYCQPHAPGMEGTLTVE